MSLPPCVFVVYREGGLEADTLMAVRRQWSRVQLRLTTFYNKYAYANTIRMLWPYPADIVIVEQDVVPPPESIANLFDCPEPWCTHRGWVGNRYHDDTLQLAKFSSQLRGEHPRLADDALVTADHSSWVRQGWTRIEPDANPATLHRYGRRACLRQDAADGQAMMAVDIRPSTVDWVTVDSKLARQLRKTGYEPHVHEPPPTHLHDYEARPVNRAED